MIPLIKDAFRDETKTRAALAAFIASGSRLSMGSQCAAFEREFAAYQGSSHAVLFNSGASANLALLQALTERLTPAAHVGFSAVTWPTNVMPIIQMGMVPVPVDVDPRTLNCGPLQLAHVAGDIEAFFITNALGLCGDLPVIKDVCKRTDVLLIEDNCEALGTVIGGKRTGTFGHAATFSFFIAHHLSTIEGGMVCTNSGALDESLRMVRANGWDRNLSAAQQTLRRQVYGVLSEFDAKYTFYDLAYNLRPTEVTGFLGRNQLPFLPESVASRQRNFLRLEEAMGPHLLRLAHDHIDTLSAFAFPVLCRDKETRDRLVARFVDASVEVRPIIAGNILRQPFWQQYVSRVDYGGQQEFAELPGAEFVHNCGFYFGAGPDLAEADLDLLCNLLGEK